MKMFMIRAIRIMIDFRYLIYGLIIYIYVPKFNRFYHIFVYQEPLHMTILWLCASLIEKIRGGTNFLQWFNLKRCTICDKFKIMEYSSPSCNYPSCSHECSLRAHLRSIHNLTPRAGPTAVGI